jgi:23S rRNA (cytosine1962-C5)-methyltransferase
VVALSLLTFHISLLTASMAGIVIKPRARILHGHDWVYSSEVLKVFGKPADGAVISLRDGRDHLIGSAIYNSKSQIVARRFSRRKQDLDLDFFRRRIDQAAEYRVRRGIGSRLCRLVWSESDGLPGVIVDRYNDVFVLQTLTLAMDQRKELIVEAMADLYARTTASVAGEGGTPALQTESSGICIVERNDAAIRKAEGLDSIAGVLRGEDPGRIEIEIGNVKFAIDLLHGHKTGFYLDQRENYRIVAEHAKDRRVLDCFSNQGAFAVTCARAGASQVTAVEENVDNMDAAQRNASLNGVQIDLIRQDVFSFLRSAEKAGAEYDLIILDPPSFTKAKSGLRDALRGYHELHLRAFKLLSKNGLLVTFSCSHHVTEAVFTQTIADSLVDARRSARQLRRFEQALDHPVLPTIPETEYFKGFLLEMMPGR